MATLWTFRTKRFRVVLTARLDPEPDLSWRDAEQVAYDKAHGVRYYETKCAVYLDGAEIAADYLGGSGYSDIREFATAHRDADPMNRNCSIMRRARGANTSICHYFPDMVAAAVAEARKAIGRKPYMRGADS